MPKIVSVTAFREGGSYDHLTVSLLVLQDGIDVHEAVCAACKDYALSPEGWDVYEKNMHEFNWIDFVTYVSDEFCVPHGFKKLQHPHPSLLKPLEVNVDEELFDHSCMDQEQIVTEILPVLTKLDPRDQSRFIGMSGMRLSVPPHDPAQIRDLLETAAYRLSMADLICYWVKNVRPVTKNPVLTNGNPE